MVEAMKLLNDDESVKAVFINIFGGILKCDVLTQSILTAAKQVGLKKPIVLRLKGTPPKEAREAAPFSEAVGGLFCLPLPCAAKWDDFLANGPTFANS